MGVANGQAHRHAFAGPAPALESAGCGLYTAAVTIRLYNTLSGKPEPVTPGPNGEIGLYVCGLTVYDYAHVGNMCSALTYDVLVRHLR